MCPPFPRRALISVTDKHGLDAFARGLVELGFEIVSTGGTRRFLQQHEIDVIDVASCTGFPEIMDGRVKTLHPAIHGGILGRPDRPDDATALREHDIAPFELVVCNLYRFQEAVSRPEVNVEEAIEEIDIGGPAMIRAAAKNHKYVGVITSPRQYDTVLEALRGERFDEAFRRRLAADAFDLTARYDRAVADYLQVASGRRQPADAASDFPAVLPLEFHKKADLRYGENPHQRAAFYTQADGGAGTLAGARRLHGKQLSYNNLLDLDAALSTARDFEPPAAVVIKHTNPCGCAVAENLADAFDKAYAGDPVSAFGSVVAFNRPVDAATAEKLCQPNRFIEAIIAPRFAPEAYEALTTRPTWKKNVRLLECEPPERRGRSEAAGALSSGLDLRSVGGGLLAQDRDDAPELPDEWRCLTERRPNEAELADLKFAWTVAKHVKSNAIVFARERGVVGVGAGQMSRLDSVTIAARKAGERSRGSVMASDAFFPFRDGVDEAAAAGITAVIQPGGSRRDDEVIAACNEHHIAMLFTARRHFRH